MLISSLPKLNFLNLHERTWFDHTLGQYTMPGVYSIQPLHPIVRLYFPHSYHQTISFLRVFRSDSRGGVDGRILQYDISRLSSPLIVTPRSRSELNIQNDVSSDFIYSPPSLFAIHVPLWCTWIRIYKKHISLIFFIGMHPRHRPQPFPRGCFSDREVRGFVYKFKKSPF